MTHPFIAYYVALAQIDDSRRAAARPDRRARRRNARLARRQEHIEAVPPTAPEAERVPSFV